MGAIKKIGKGIGGALFGKKGSAGRGPGFLSDDLAERNLEEARGAFDMTRDIRSQQQHALRQLQGDLNNLNVNPEIEMRRRALGRSAEQQQRQLGAGLARRGLSGSAAGLFAQSQANRANQDALLDLEAQAPLIKQQREAALRGEMGRIYSQAQQVTPQLMDAGVAPTQGSPGLFGQAVGAGLSAFGGGIGKQLGAFGDRVGGSIFGPRAASSGGTGYPGGLSREEAMNAGLIGNWSSQAPISIAANPVKRRRSRQLALNDYRMGA